MNNVIEIIKSLENSGVLIHDITETVKHEIKKIKKKIEAGILPKLLAPLAT